MRLLHLVKVPVWLTNYLETPMALCFLCSCFIVSDVVSIFIHRQDGERLAAIVDNGTRVLMQISFSRVQTNALNSMNRTSVLFVAISFIVLMVISVAWLIFYYIQRFRYAHTKDRLSVINHCWHLCFNFYIVNVLC